jgi:hypothetical protein
MRGLESILTYAVNGRTMEGRPRRLRLPPSAVVLRLTAFVRPDKIFVSGVWEDGVNPSLPRNCKR